MQSVGVFLFIFREMRLESLLCICDENHIKLDKTGCLQTGVRLVATAPLLFVCIEASARLLLVLIRKASQGLNESKKEKKKKSRFTFIKV